MSSRRDRAGVEGRPATCSGGRDGAVPRLKDDPPLIFHPTREQAPGMESQYGETIERRRGSLAEPIRALFDRFHFCDLAFKVVGIGSVGTRCAVALFMAADDDPLFLQV